ncbi:hypothetical protein GGI22_005707 [Coemansia erecta]|nr:hypothetical protein GGI22_005707 [Coemansia erecta]
MPTKNALSSSSDTEDSNSKLLGPGTGMAGYPQPQGSPPQALLPGSRQARVLPRSPLANPAVMGITDEVQGPPSSLGSGPEPSGSTGASLNGTPAAAEQPSSSDDDGLTCRVCNRYRGLEWIVGCNNNHHLCFGCVQAHVKQLLASTDAFRVPCPLNRCDAHIPGRYLRDCLPPQRMQQLEANRRRSDRPARAITRYFSLGGHKVADNSASVRSANDSDEGFDAPVVVVDNSSAAELKPRALTDQLRIHNGVTPSNRALDRAMARVLISDPQRHSASMPLLPQACASPESSGTADSPTPLFMSELTKVSTEKGSVNSLVLAASVAADSGLSLSPQSVGSRLRRVPKIPGNLNADVASIGSPEAVTSDRLGLSPPSLGQSVFLHHTSTAQDDIEPLPQAFAGHVYDYSAIDFDVYMQTPPLRPSHAMSFASSSSPISWQSPVRPAGQRGHRNVHSIISPKQQPEAPPPRPLQFRATATWITPEQRHSGYAENILLSATLFETIRRRPTPSDGDDSDDDEGRYHHNAPQIPHVYTGHRHPMPEIPKTPLAAEDDDSVGVYIPTWRRPETALRKYVPSPWDDIVHYGSQSGILCEAAELNFDLYETLHKRR